MSDCDEHYDEALMDDSVPLNEDEVDDFELGEACGLDPEVCESCQ